MPDTSIEVFSSVDIWARKNSALGDGTPGGKQRGACLQEICEGKGEGHIQGRCWEGKEALRPEKKHLGGGRKKYDSCLVCKRQIS